jgi:hypothetical protein
MLIPIRTGDQLYRTVEDEIEPMHRCRRGEFYRVYPSPTEVRRPGSGYRGYIERILSIRRIIRSPQSGLGNDRLLASVFVRNARVVVHAVANIPNLAQEAPDRHNLNSKVRLTALSAQFPIGMPPPICMKDVMTFRGRHLVRD